MNPAKTLKLGRNDPCHCGSGRKYKDCHLRIEEEWRSQQLRLRNAQDQLLQRILAKATEAEAAELQTAFDRYWQQRYQFAQLAELKPARRVRGRPLHGLVCLRLSPIRRTDTG